MFWLIRQAEVLSGVNHNIYVKALMFTKVNLIFKKDRASALAQFIFFLLFCRFIPVSTITSPENLLIITILLLLLPMPWVLQLQATICSLKIKFSQYKNFGMIPTSNKFIRREMSFNYQIPPSSKLEFAIILNLPFCFFTKIFC